MFGKTTKQVDVELFTIYDSKTKSYREPTYAPNKDVLMREVLNMFKDPGQAKNPIFTNAEDFSIFRIGTYDRKTGKLEAQELEHIVNMHDLRALAGPTVGINPT